MIIGGTKASLAGRITGFTLCIFNVKTSWTFTFKALIIVENLAYFAAGTLAVGLGTGFTKRTTEQTLI